MILEKYWELLREMNELYDAQKYSEIIEFLENKKNFPYGKAALYYSGICAASKLGDTKRAVDFIEMIYDEGGWYSEFILTKSPSLQPLQEISEFKILVQKCEERSKQALKEKNDVTVLPKEKQTSYPLVLGIHADSGVIEEEIKFWKPAVDKGYIVGMPRSSNIYWSGKDSAYWNNNETDKDRILDYMKSLQGQYKIDMESIIIGGLSSGAQLALWMALSESIPVSKFIAVAPGGQLMNDPEKWQPLIDNITNKDLSGMIILGKDDKVVSHENIHTLVKMLNDSGINFQIHEYPNLGHWYPPDFAEKLLTLL